MIYDEIDFGVLWGLILRGSGLWELESLCDSRESLLPLVMGFGCVWILIGVKLGLDGILLQLHVFENLESHSREIGLRVRDIEILFIILIFV